MSDTIPVILFAYRRRDLLIRCLESLRLNNVPLIYAFSDGTSDNALAADVADVRALLRTVDWTRIEIVESPVNLGVGPAILNGITQVLAQHEMAVIVEEDLEFRAGAYDFVCRALRHYRNEPKAMGVTAWTQPKVTPPGVTQPYFSGRKSSLIWGTWRRAWDGMLDATAVERRDECRAKGIDPSRYGDDLVDSVEEEDVKGFWDFRFNLHMLAQGGLFLFPAETMARHLGYDSRATNSPHGAEWEGVPVDAPDPSRVVWPNVVEHPQSAALWRDAINQPRRTMVSRIRSRLLRLVQG
mgnify:CR=1 FL=1